MIGFSIMMWFISLILCIVSVSLLRGNTASMHGKVFDETKDKIGYAKASGKAVLILAIGILLTGIVALLGSELTGICNALIVLLFVILLDAYLFIQIQKTFRHKD